MPHAKRVLFALLCMLAPLVLLSVAEITLRRLEYGGYDPVIREVGETKRGTLVATDQDGARGFFFANRDRPGYNNQYVFDSPKASGTIRVFMVGGSAIKGFPQPPVFAASAFLEEMLSDCWPLSPISILVHEKVW